MSDERQDTETRAGPQQAALEACPHCGEWLSPWQQVLLAVDRALVCKKCWYRIIIEIPADAVPKGPETPPPAKG